MRREKLIELENYISELKTIRKEDLPGSSKFLQVKRGLFYLNNGKQIVREEVLKNGHTGNACVILPLTPEKEVILVVEPRVYNDRTVGIELPAGYVEEGEDAKLCATRELAEETGYLPEKVVELAKYYQDQGCMGSLNHAFLALNCLQNSPQHLDKDEFIRYFKCLYSELLELVDLGYINDANSLLTIEKAKQYLKK